MLKTSDFRSLTLFDEVSIASCDDRTEVRASSDFFPFKYINLI